jgi:hypothetical protein
MVNLRRSLVINFFSSSGATIAQFVVSIVLARMLSPGEIGVFSMTVVFVNIAHIFREFGVGTYLQREPELTPEKMRAATGVMFTTSWIIAIALYFSSPWISQWFKEPAMIPVMRVLAIGFVFVPFGSITHSLLTREFAAGKQAIVNVVGTATFTITCLGLAFLGFGTMSMAWANLANIIACAIAYIPLRPRNLPWMPSFRHWRNVVHFGVGTLLSNCLASVNNAVADILLGKLGNATLVGLFSRAGSTVSIFGYIAGSTVNYGSVSYISQAHHRGEPLGPLLNKATHHPVWRQMASCSSRYQCPGDRWHHRHDVQLHLDCNDGNRTPLPVGNPAHRDAAYPGYFRRGPIQRRDRKLFMGHMRGDDRLGAGNDLPALRLSGPPVHHHVRCPVAQCSGDTQLHRRSNCFQIDAASFATCNVRAAGPGAAAGQRLVPCVAPYQTSAYSRVAPCRQRVEGQVRLSNY